MSSPTPSHSLPAAKPWQVVVALGAVYVVWGSTYLGMKVAIATLPPFAHAALRFAAAGLLLLAITRCLGMALPTARQWAAAAVVGGLLFVGGNGLVAWAEQWVPSGITAVLIAGTPVWMVLLPWLTGLEDRPSGTEMAGIVIGTGGVVVLVVGNDQGHAGAQAFSATWLLGAFGILGASVLWAVGSLLARRLPKPASPFVAGGAQMLCGSALLALLAAVRGEWPAVFTAEAWPTSTVLAMGFLVLIGAIVGFGAYIFLLSHVRSMATVASYSYVNPVVAVFLGWLIGSEHFHPLTWLAAGVVVVGVALMIGGKRPAVAPALALPPATGVGAPGPALAPGLERPAQR